MDIMEGSSELTEEQMADLEAGSSTSTSTPPSIRTARSAAR
jgi:hypothetical protein